MANIGASRINVGSSSPGIATNAHEFLTLQE